MTEKVKFHRVEQQMLELVRLFDLMDLTPETLHDMKRLEDHLHLVLII